MHQPGSRVAAQAASSAEPASPSPVRRLLSEPVQAGLVPRAGGQPAVRMAWESDAVNAACGGFYRQTRGTLDQAWVRPRFRGWIAFQDRGSAVIRGGLRGRSASIQILRQLRLAFRACCLAARLPGP
jgi:multiple sugar transport system substrate-binding protein